MQLLFCVLAAALAGAAQGQKANVPPTPVPNAWTAMQRAAGTTPKPGTTTPNYFYDDEDLVHSAAAKPITDSPVPAHHIPTSIKTATYGFECTIQSVAFPGEYLRMSSGYIHYYPELKMGNPKSNDTEWDWTGVWKIDSLDFGRGKTSYRFHNQATGTFMTYNSTRYGFVKGVKKEHYLANLWDVETAFRHGGAMSTIQHSQHPNGFLHAISQKKKNKPRAIGILVAEPDKEIYQWKIHCDPGRGKNKQ